MISNAYVVITCDRCWYVSEEVELTTTTKGYDERDLIADIKSLGWAVNGDEHYCPGCKEENELEAEDENRT